MLHGHPHWGAYIVKKIGGSMKRKEIKPLLLVFLNAILIFCLISCTPNASGNDSSHNNQVTAKNYSGSFRVSGYYICYDGIHYQYHCSSVNDVKEIIKYYYPDCFDVKVYEPGTEQTGYLNTIFYATWKSYLDYVQIR